MSEWISLEDNSPYYGEPVLICANGVTQHVTYLMDGADDTQDWFEPYHFDHDDDQKIWRNKVTHYMPLPAPPIKQQ